MKDGTLSGWIDLAVVSLLFVGFFFLGRATKQADVPDPVIIETIVEKHDTLEVSVPDPEAERQVGRLAAQVRLSRVLIDSLQNLPPTYVHDSVQVVVDLPKTQRVYDDSTFHAVVSGYDPVLDTLLLYRTTKYVYNTQYVETDPSRWAIAATGGLGVGRDGLTPYVGIGLSYDLVRFKRRGTRKH